jgi:hypothetical protein
MAQSSQAEAEVAQMAARQALVTSSWRGSIVTSGNYFEPIKSGLVGSGVGNDIVIRKGESESSVHIRPVCEDNPIAAQNIRALQDIAVIRRSAIMNSNLVGAVGLYKFNPGLIGVDPNRD